MFCSNGSSGKYAKAPAAPCQADASSPWINQRTRVGSVKRSVRNKAGERSLPNPFACAAALNLRGLIVASIVTLAGCATQEPAPAPPAPVAIAASTGWEIDCDINSASLAAREPAREYARDSMEKWKERVHKRTEADFIPWYTDYWTQQWLAIKVAWYKLSAGEGADPTVTRLVAYLQEQYHDRVLDPVSQEIDPNVVRDRATKLYVQRLGEQLQEIPRRYGVPSEQFDQRIKDIPAIALAPHPAQSASLYQIVHADPITRLPAYAALSAQIRNASGRAGAGPSDATISPVAKRTSEELVDKLATSGGASAAAAVVGGVAGMIISMGAAGLGAITHESERPEMEARLRKNLDAALDELYLGLLEDPATGVMAGVNHIAGQIEGSLAKTLTQPARFEPAPQGIPLPGERPP